MKFCIILSARALNTKTKGFVNNHGNLSRPHKLYAKRILWCSLYITFTLNNFILFCSWWCCQQSYSNMVCFLAFEHPRFFETCAVKRKCFLLNSNSNIIFMGLSKWILKSINSTVKWKCIELEIIEKFEYSK